MKQLSFLLLTLLLCLPAQAQTDDFSILYETEPGFVLPALLDSATTRFRDRNDPNGDGNLDLTAVREDAEGNPVEIVTFDVVKREPIWRIPYQDVADVLGDDAFRFLGFFSFTASQEDVWAAFRSRAAVALVLTDLLGAGKLGTAEAFVVPAERVATLDLTGDDVAELIVQNPETNTVQVWSGGDTGTATEEEIEAALFRLFQNYPNPFHDRTTIAYDVERPGPVTVTVFDLLGRRVRTLVDETQPAGTHQAVWDGRDAVGQPVASGTYFYRLRVGEAVSSKQVIRIQ